MWIALGSAAGAIAAAVVAIFQVHVASAQNAAAEQQELLTLTTSIAQQFAQQQATINAAAGSLTGTARTTAISNASVGIENQLLADGQAAQALITKLNGNGVVGVEYVQVAKALAAGDDTAQAIKYYNDALSAPPYSAVTRADSLRNEGNLYYSLGQPATGHQYMMRAVAVYNGHHELTPYNIDNSIAQSYLYDAQHQLSIKGCKIAAADLAGAEKALAQAGGHTTTNSMLIISDATEAHQYCLGGSG
jgi:tetratricopeptide (TPR) repeat protein